MSRVSINRLSRTEHQMATRKRRAELAGAGDDLKIEFRGTSVPLDADEHLLPIPESRRVLISLTGKGFERALLGKLDWLTYLYVLCFYSTPCFLPWMLWNG